MKPKETVKEAAGASPESARKLVMALYGEEYGKTLLAAYRRDRQAEIRSWLQSLLHRAASEAPLELA